LSEGVSVTAAGERPINGELAAGRAFHSNFIQLDDEIEVASRLSKAAVKVSGSN